LQSFAASYSLYNPIIGSFQISSYYSGKFLIVFYDKDWREQILLLKIEKNQ
jgi:hypothetical protein